MVTPGFVVAVPELNIVAEPVHRSAPKPGEGDPQRKVEPDDRASRADHRVTKLAVIVAIDHPAIRCGVQRRANACGEFSGIRLAPVRAVVEGVELDKRHAEPACQIRSERGFANAGSTLDHDSRHDSLTLPAHMRSMQPERHQAALLPNAAELAPLYLSLIHISEPTRPY